MTFQTNDNFADRELSIDELDTAGGGLSWPGDSGLGAPGRHVPVGGGSNLEGHPGVPTLKQF
jgi:hypothetical protein